METGCFAERAQTVTVIKIVGEAPFAGTVSISNLQPISLSLYSTAVAVSELLRRAGVRHVVVGGAVVIGILAPVVLGFWLNSRLASTERSAVRREDVAAAIQKSAEMGAAKRGDDLMLIKQQLDRVAVGVSLPDVRAAKTKGMRR